MDGVAAEALATCCRHCNLLDQGPDLQAVIDLLTLRLLAAPLIEDDNGAVEALHERVGLLLAVLQRVTLRLGPRQPANLLRTAMGSCSLDGPSTGHRQAGPPSGPGSKASRPPSRGAGPGERPCGPPPPAWPPPSTPAHARPHGRSLGGPRRGRSPGRSTCLPGPRGRRGPRRHTGPGGTPAAAPTWPCRRPRGPPRGVRGVVGGAAGQEGGQGGGARGRCYGLSPPARARPPESKRKNMHVHICPIRSGLPRLPVWWPTDHPTTLTSLFPFYFPIDGSIPDSC